ncbi:MAG: hypothetical protein CEN89_544 [Candidatus Berkelbacteria bacterium Licking1014_7]|uniref:Uncharacterized protein n=1 Tax=Candidatus Berkelbacteria bacterium Licking1014_7 TaxID=2017147 RepID=A0A554LIH0_9BACT|nr:MAG: hypothetical protein CEN89_544 [Candidatus Berkelbacteria bacterium Licking1014_7]
MQTEHIVNLHKSTEKLAQRKSCWYGFLYGIALGLGATIGVAVVSGVLFYILQQLRQLPFVNSEYINNIIELLQDNLDKK